MKKDMNYITTLPDFIEMQRLSFSWFISQGLSEELSHFSSILDFSNNIESLIFGQQYKLIKPFYTALDAKKDAKSYVAQLQVLIEIRDRSANIILKRERISIVNLPLMTQAATFIINGCERVVVSQIIRSPGIYFEKNKKFYKNVAKFYCDLKGAEKEGRIWNDLYRFYVFKKIDLFWSWS